MTNLGIAGVPFPNFWCQPKLVVNFTLLSVAEHLPDLHQQTSPDR